MTRAVNSAFAWCRARHRREAAHVGHAKFCVRDVLWACCACAFESACGGELSISAGQDTRVDSLHLEAGLAGSNPNLGN